MDMTNGDVPGGDLVPHESGPLLASQILPGRPLETRTPEAPRAPIHHGSGLPLDDSLPSRDESWAAMSVTIRGRLAELAGEVIEWFAWHDISSAERPRAVVLGTRALCIAEPGINAAGRAVYELNRYEFVSRSHRIVPVQHRPGPSGGAAPIARTQSSSSLPQPASDLGLSSDEKGQLGNLPPTAQELLQAPFSSKDPVRRCEYWYWGFPNRLDIYIFILAGRHFVTAATGTQRVPVGQPSAGAHWNLTCHRLAVNQVIGS
jgi:hypothetical protein